MDEQTQQDIRSLLKRFGVAADEAIREHLARTRGTQPLHIRITLEDLTPYGEDGPEEELRVEIEGEVRRE